MGWREGIEMINYDVEIQFKGEPVLEVFGIPALTVNDAKAKAVTQAREWGYRAKIVKQIAKRRS
jgi:hypothetical protein